MFLNHLRISASNVLKTLLNIHAIFFYKNQQLSAEAGLFLIFWRFQPQFVVIKTVLIS